MSAFGDKADMTRTGPNVSLLTSMEESIFASRYGGTWFMTNRKFDLLHGEAAKQFTKELTRNLVDHNRSVGPLEQWQELVISVEADDSGALGGLAGYTHWQWLFVGHIWVKADDRRQGIGAQLLT